MLKIIQTPINSKTLYTLPGKRWFPEFKIFSSGIYFEYSDDSDFIRFQFFYALGRVTILDGSWAQNFSSSEMEAFFDTQVNFTEFWEWLDNKVSFEVIKKSIEDSSISGIWKMEDSISLGIGNIFSLENKPDILTKYYEFRISTVIIRCLPYNCWSDSIRFEVSDEKNKIYWITLCLLKYQRQLNRLSKE